MSIQNPRNRIWDNLRNTERMALYYSKRSRQLEKDHKWLTFPNALIPVVAVFVSQQAWESRFWIASIILFAGAVLQLALLHFGSGGDVKAAKIMGNLNAELAQHWKKLWIEQKHINITLQIEMLESIGNQTTTEPIAHHTRKGENRLNTQCAKDVNHALSIQYGA